MAIDIIFDESIEVSKEQFKIFMRAYQKLTGHALLDQEIKALNTHKYLDLEDKKYIHELPIGFTQPAILFTKVEKDDKCSYSIYKKLYDDLFESVKGDL